MHAGDQHDGDATEDHSGEAGRSRDETTDCQRSTMTRKRELKKEGKKSEQELLLVVQVGRNLLCECRVSYRSGAMKKLVEVEGQVGGEVVDELVAHVTLESHRVQVLLGRYPDEETQRHQRTHL